MKQNKFLKKTLIVILFLAFIVGWITFRVMVFDSKGDLGIIDYIVLAFGFFYAFGKFKEEPPVEE